VRALPHEVGDAELLGQRREQIDARRQRVDRAAARHAGPVHQQGDVAERAVDRHRRLAPPPALAEVVAVVGAHDHAGGRPEIVTIKGIQDPPEPVVDHRELRAVLGPHLPALALVERPVAARVTRVRRPDEMRTRPLGVVHRRVRLGGVEGLVRVELVDH